MFLRSCMCFAKLFSVHPSSLHFSCFKYPFLIFLEESERCGAVTKYFTRFGWNGNGNVKDGQCRCLFGFCDFYKLRALSLTVMCMWQLGYVIWSNRFRKVIKERRPTARLVSVNATVRCFFWWNSNYESDLHAWWAPAVKSVGEMQTAKKVVKVPLSDGGKKLKPYLWI